MIKNILLTSDLSENSKEAFAIAADFAKKFNAKIKVLAVIEDPAQAAIAFAIENPIAPDLEIRKQLNFKVKTDLEAAASNYLTDINYECIVNETKTTVAQEILGAAKKLESDLIIMATHGRSGLKNILIGSITEKIVRQSTIPVMVIPRK